MFNEFSFKQNMNKQKKNNCSVFLLGTESANSVPSLDVRFAA